MSALILSVVNLSVTHAPPSTPSTYFVTAYLQTILRTKFLGIFAVYPRAKFHIPTHNKEILNTIITHYYFP